MTNLLRPPDGIRMGALKCAGFVIWAMITPVALLLFDGDTPLSERAKWSAIILCTGGAIGGLFGVVRALLLKWSFNRLAHGDGWPSSR